MTEKQKQEHAASEVAEFASRSKEINALYEYSLARNSWIWFLRPSYWVSRYRYYLNVRGKVGHFTYKQQLRLRLQNVSKPKKPKYKAPKAKLTIAKVLPIGEFTVYGNAKYRSRTMVLKTEGNPQGLLEQSEPENVFEVDYNGRLWRRNKS